MDVTVRGPIDVGYERLKPGPGKSPEQVRKSQQARIHRAMVDLVSEHGFSGVTIRLLTQTSGVSTRTFYAHFSDLDECFASVYRSIMKWVEDELSAATRSGDGLESGIQIWMRNLTAAAAKRPEMIRLAFVDAYDGGPAMLREIASGTAALEDRLAADPNPIPMTIARAVVAGVERVLSRRLVERRSAELPGLAGDLADWVIRAHLTRPHRQARSLATRNPQGISIHDDPGLSAFRAIGGDHGRVLRAAVTIGATKGYWALTAPRIRREAGVSRRCFEALFDSAADCYLDAIEVMVLAVAARTRGSGLSEGDWSTSIERMSYRLLSEIWASPLLSRLISRDVLAAGDLGRRRTEELITAAASWLRSEAPRHRRPSCLTAEASTAAAWRVIQAELRDDGRTPAAALTPMLACLLLTACVPRRQDAGAVRKH
jgi:AcrR family transcriptional regulator